MIINIRGASGSGKSTIVRAIMDQYDDREPMFVHDRKRPIGYRLERLGGKPLYVIGHYETPCGGCDTIAKDAMNEIHRLARAAHHQGLDVLFEGLLVSAEANRMIKMHSDGLPVAVVVLDVDLDTCLAGVMERRKARGASLELGPNTLKNLASKHKGALRCMERFEEVGMNVVLMNRDRALTFVEDVLEL